MISDLAIYDLLRENPVSEHWENNFDLKVTAQNIFSQFLHHTLTEKTLEN